jgi:hypothetical protein
MRRLLHGAVLLLVGATACTGSSPLRSTARTEGLSSPAGSAPSPSDPASATPASTSPRQQVTLPGLTLRADPSEPLRPWKEVLFVPFGKQEEQLGYEEFGEGRPTVPKSFAVDLDGSFWIVDKQKLRVAHYGPDGTYLGSAGPLGLSAVDVIANEDGVFVVDDFVAGVLAQVRRDGSLRHFEVVVGERHLSVSDLFAPGPHLAVWPAGFTDAVNQPPFGYASVDPSTGQATLLPGLPAGPDRWLDFRSRDVPDAPGAQDFELVYLESAASAAGSTIQPIHVDLVARKLDGSLGSGGHSIPAEVGAGYGVSAATGAITRFVLMSPSQTVDQRRYRGARWLLGIGPGPGPVVWERLPDPIISDEGQRRFLATQAGAAPQSAALYLMILERDGAHMFRRP